MRKAILVLLICAALLASQESSVAQEIRPKTFPVTIEVADEMIEGHIKVYRVLDEETGAILYVIRGYQVFGVAMASPKTECTVLQVPLVREGQ